MRHFRHRDLCRFIAPAIGAKMIPAQDQTGERETDPGGNGLDKISKARWRHAGITAELIDLIGRRFNQDVAVAVQIKTQRRLYH